MLNFEEECNQGDYGKLRTFKNSNSLNSDVASLSQMKSYFLYPYEVRVLKNLGQSAALIFPTLSCFYGLTDITSKFQYGKTLHLLEEA